MQEFAANCVVFASNSMPDLRRICIEFVVRQCDANSMQYLRRICIEMWLKSDAISMQFCVELASSICIVFASDIGQNTMQIRCQFCVEIASKLHRILAKIRCKYDANIRCKYDAKMRLVYLRALCLCLVCLSPSCVLSVCPPLPRLCLVLVVLSH